jgi:hypothetical protein
MEVLSGRVFGHDNEKGADEKCSTAAGRSHESEGSKWKVFGK